eukprot:gnl/MRDRNA2_/MRDRNA2_28734_c0_seq1.p1 gnl/MRDRNA2_/MRDRNA2_28734_c0~~gnl/MRDRNA2_/MRDRNA2_28734_c0_seq1.p1  ORF type:complete len:300 (+),score=49.87 gnl/MRDRNA2_/MRDRNA2_28734_c0_seq1:45-944(+)
MCKLTVISLIAVVARTYAKDQGKQRLQKNRFLRWTYKATHCGDFDDTTLGKPRGHLVTSSSLQILRLPHVHAQSQSTPSQDTPALSDTGNSKPHKEASRSNLILPGNPAFQKMAAEIQGAKIHTGGRDTDLNEEDARDMMVRDFHDARESLYRDLPTDVRILKYILGLDTLEERKAGLEDAFTLGPDYVDGDTEYLSTTPQSLLTTIDTLLYLEAKLKGKGKSLVQFVDGSGRKQQFAGDPKGLDLLSDMRAEAASILAPRILERLYELRVIVRRDFMTDQTTDSMDDRLKLFLGKGDG